MQFAIWFVCLSKMQSYGREIQFQGMRSVHMPFGERRELHINMLKKFIKPLCTYVYRLYKLLYSRLYYDAMSIKIPTYCTYSAVFSLMIFWKIAFHAVIIFRLVFYWSGAPERILILIYKPHCHYQNFSPLANVLYLTATTNKTPLRNGNCPITDSITKMGVAHTVW